MDTLAVRLTIPPAGFVRDFHPQVGAPCRAHKARTGDPLSGSCVRDLPTCHARQSIARSPAQAPRLYASISVPRKPTSTGVRRKAAGATTNDNSDVTAT